MKVFRQFLRSKNGAQPVVFAYIRANWFERRVIRHKMLAGENNLRPAHNWPGPKQFKASFIMRRKGAANPDIGPDRDQPSKLITWLFKREFTNFDGIGLSIATVPAIYGWFITSGLVLSAFVGVGVYVRIKQLRGGNYE